MCVWGEKGGWTERFVNIEEDEIGGWMERGNRIADRERERERLDVHITS